MPGVGLDQGRWSGEVGRRSFTVSFLIPPVTKVPFRDGTVPETKTRPWADVPPERRAPLLPRYVIGPVAL